MTIDKSSKVWDGVYRSFAEAAGEDTVFEGNVWLDKMVTRASMALSAAQAQGSIPPVAVTVDYALPFIAAAHPDKWTIYLFCGYPVTGPSILLLARTRLPSRRLP